MEGEGILFHRVILEKIEKLIERPEIIGIRGPRQAGKTTLMKMLASRIKEGEKKFVNMDLYENRREFEGNPMDFIKRFKSEGKKLFLFLDEVQRCENAGESLKIIYDEFENMKIFASSSSSLEIKTNLAPFLVGRIFFFDLLTFDFEEYLMAKDEGLAKLFKEKKRSLKECIEGRGELSQPSFENEFLKLLKEYVVFGGYPEVIKAKDEELRKLILKQIVNLYLEKDIISFFGITDTRKFEDFVKVLAFRTGNIVSLSSVSSETKVSYGKCEEFLNILIHSYVIKLLRPFHRNLVTEIRKSPKVYFIDLGLRNAIIDNFVPFDNRTDRGAIMENFVFRELLNFEDWKIDFWRTTGKAEIDFILTKGDEIVPIEVKTGERKLSRGFYSFIKTYKPDRAFIVTLDVFKMEKIQDTDVYWVPAFYL